MLEGHSGRFFNYVAHSISVQHSSCETDVYLAMIPHSKTPVFHLFYSLVDAL